MANQFVNLPAPAANGAGAWVDVSTFGAVKTITSVGNGFVFEPIVTIECSNETSSPTGSGFPLKTFFTPDEQTFTVACMWMRAVVSNYKGGGAPTVNVGGTDDGTSNAELVATAGNGTGASVDVSDLPILKTVQVIGPFRGQVNVEISEDGGTTWNQAFSFQSPGHQTAILAADFMRVERNGVPLVTPGLPQVWVAATEPPGGGGGGGGSALLPVVDLGTVAGDGTVNLQAGKMNLVDTDSNETTAFGQFPAANSVPNGTLLGVKLVNDLDDDGDPMGTLELLADGADALDGYPTSFPVVEPDVCGQSLLWVSDGNSTWWFISTWLPSETTGSDQALIYTATGAEDPDGFDLNIPVAMGGPGFTDYVVEVTLFTDDPDNIYQVTSGPVDESTIRVITTSSLTVGDKLQFFIKRTTGHF